MVAFNKLNKPSVVRKATSNEYKLARSYKGATGLPGIIARYVLEDKLLTDKQFNVLHLARCNDIDARCRRHSYSPGDDFHESDYECGAYDLNVDWAK